MNFPAREVIIAILGSLILGTVIGYGAWQANQAIKQKEASLSPVPTAGSVPEILPTSNNQSGNSGELGLNLSQPEISAFTNLGTQVVSGTTLPGANVFVYGENDQTVVLADDSGQFFAEVNLIKGINYVKVTSIADSGEQISLTRTVVFSEIEI